MTKLLFIDSETGGTDPAKHSLLTLALGVWKDGIITQTLDIKLKHKAYVVTSTALKINRIDLVELADKGMTPEDARMAIKVFVLSNFFEGKPTLAGHNVSFDIGFLKTLFTHEEYEELFDYRSIDISTLIRTLDISGMAPLGKGGLGGPIRHYGIEELEGDRHTALGDMLITAEVFGKLLNEIRRENEEDVSDDQHDRNHYD